MNKTEFRLKITSIDYTPDGNAGENESFAPEISEYVTDADFFDGDNCEITYREHEELGMGDTSVKVCWKKSAPQVVSVMRSGEVETVMTFETGIRHITAYRLPGMSFDLCTRAIRVDNSFDVVAGGEIYLDYIIEIRGAVNGRRKMILEVLPKSKKS